MSNVIRFPVKNTQPIITTDEQMAEAVRNMRTSFVDLLTDDMGHTIMMKAHLEGFDLGAPKCTKAFGFGLEAIRAALLKSIDIDHFLHDIAETCVTVEDSPEDETEGEEQ